MVAARKQRRTGPPFTNDHTDRRNGNATVPKKEKKTHTHTQPQRAEHVGMGSSPAPSPVRSPPASSMNGPMHRRTRAPDRLADMTRRAKKRSLDCFTSVAHIGGHASVTAKDRPCWTRHARTSIGRPACRQTGGTCIGARLLDHAEDKFRMEKTVNELALDHKINGPLSFYCSIHRLNPHEPAPNWAYHATALLAFSDPRRILNN